MIDISTARTAATRFHPPTIIVILLFSGFVELFSGRLWHGSSWIHRDETGSVYFEKAKTFIRPNQ